WLLFCFALVGMDDRLSLSLIHCAGSVPLPARTPGLRLQAGELTRSIPAMLLPVVMPVTGVQASWLESPLFPNKGRPMAQSYSARSRAIEPFHVMALLARANQLQADGHDVIHLEIGEPDFTTAAPIVAAGQAALADGHTRYTAARGLPALREAISSFYGQRYGLDIDPQRILITPGGSGALLLASSLLVDPGKHWLLADPGYPCNRHFLRLVEGA